MQVAADTTLECSFMLDFVIKKACKIQQRKYFGKKSGQGSLKNKKPVLECLTLIKSKFPVPTYHAV